MKTNQTIGQKILWDRLKKALSRSKLAKLSGIDVQRIADIERELVSPTESEVSELFKIIDKSSASDHWRTYSTHYKGAK